MGMNSNRNFLVIFTSVIALGVSGCINLVEKAKDAKIASYGISTQSTTTACGATGSSVYAASVYPYLKTNCASCHATLAPAFAGSSSDASYLIAKNYLNTSAPDQSIIYVRATDGHCGTAECRKSGTEFLPSVKSWASSETSAATCPSSGNPNGVANAGVMLRLNPTSLLQMLAVGQTAGICTQYAAAFVQNGIATAATKDLLVRLSGASTYSDIGCKVAATSVTIPTGKDGQFFYVMEPSVGDRTLLGTIDGYSIGFTAKISILAMAPVPTPMVTATTTPSVTPTPVPSVSPSPIPSPKPSVTPTPSPSVSPTPAPTPCVLTQKQNAYAQTVYPIAKTNCVGCHSAGGLPRFANATLATAYTEAKSLVSINSAANSKLYLKSKDGHCGACNATTGAFFLTQMNLWFPAETTTNCSALTSPH